MTVGEGEESANMWASPYLIYAAVANFAAYTFAPAILVTPLGAMSVIIGYVTVLLENARADLSQSYPRVLPP